MKHYRFYLAGCVGLVLCSARFGLLYAQETEIDTQRGDAMVAAYFQRETQRIARDCLAEVDSLEQWKARRPLLKQQLLEMLGLHPWPEKTDLEVVVRGETDHPEFTVRRLQFQSRPGLYVTANLFVPREVNEPLPAVLYVCGHGQVRRDGVSYGNKVYYHHHGAWLARHGYVCLILDTVQLGEIEGLHHGTYRENMWWWLNRGYTPAGVEAWNGVRGIDLLQSLEEVDPQRIGVTGRSGGGAYTWYIAAIDERVQCAVPVAGITDLENHVVDGCVEGHCDCMYMVNTYQWDYPLLAALVAPRPLLISNSDRDAIFPLDGVYRTHAKVKRIYELYDAQQQLGLNITAGGHEDTQELRVHAFRWLNRHLRSVDPLIVEPAIKLFEPEDLQVLDAIPGDQQNSTIHETFVERETSEAPTSPDAWQELSAHYRKILDEKVFAGWPASPDEFDGQEIDQVRRDKVIVRTLEFCSQGPVRLPIIVVHRPGLKRPSIAEFHVLDEEGWQNLQAQLQESVRQALPTASDRVGVYFPPRGIGPTRWDPSPRNQVQQRRRFYLLGQTLDGQRVYDVRRAMQFLRQEEGYADVPLYLLGRNAMAGIALYAALYEESVARLDLHSLPATHREGPFLLNVSRYLDLPQVAAMVAETSHVVLHDADPSNWSYVSKATEMSKPNFGGVEFVAAEQPATVSP